MFKKNKGDQKNQKFREGSVPSLAAVSLHLVGPALSSREYAWFACYLKAVLNVGMAELGEISLAPDPLYAKISCLPKNKKKFKDQPFL